jgi:16S rRNA (guanine966-N2)-methyltransferase
MRVIAGTAGGRRLVAPKGRDVRPTSDRVKEALFSSLAPRLSGARVLDLYAGSGALAIEALSRGAASAVLVERNRAALAAIERNLAATGFTAVARVVDSDLPRALDQLARPFDVVFLDPPYALAEDEIAAVLAALVPLLAPDAAVRLEWPARRPAPPWPQGLSPGRIRRYGDTTIHEAEA